MATGAGVTMDEGKQAEIDQRIAAIADALSLDPDNGYSPRSNWGYNLVVIAIPVLFFLCAMIGVWVIYQL